MHAYKPYSKIWLKPQIRLRKPPDSLLLKWKMKQNNRSQCIYCGSNQNITDDHIPPKNLFLNKKGLQLITVPACRQCNESYKKDDEYFRIFVAADISRNQQGAKLWYEKVMGSTLIRSPKLRLKLISNIKSAYIKKQNGNTSRIPFMKMDKQRIDRVLERIVKGLYWYHYNKCLPTDIVFEVSKPKPQIEGEIKDILLSKTRFHSIGNEEFKYRFRRCDNDEYQSVWGLCFFMGIHFLIFTKLENR